MFLHPGIEFSIFPSSPQQRSYVVSFLSFDEKNWSTVQATAEKKCAKHQFLKSVYYDLVVSLPQNPNENDGYHVACYQKFTAITSTTSAPGDRKYDLSERILPYLRSNSRADDKTEPSSSGIFPVTCLFCNSKKKKKKGGAIERIKMQSPISNIFEQCGKHTKCRIDSTGQDALFVVQRGHAKHVALGMAIRAITGSKKLFQVLN
ncbi:hypothetical protein GQR58_015119 [Nymphon striatum]|nr:hypothetical protein GQR58_015119 [Nymphon striatum]